MIPFGETALTLQSSDKTLQAKDHNSIESSYQNCQLYWPVKPRSRSEKNLTESFESRVLDLCIFCLLFNHEIFNPVQITGTHKPLIRNTLCRVSVRKERKYVEK